MDDGFMKIVIGILSIIFLANVYILLKLGG